MRKGPEYQEKLKDMEKLYVLDMQILRQDLDEEQKRHEESDAAYKKKVQTLQLEKLKIEANLMRKAEECNAL